MSSQPSFVPWWTRSKDAALDARVKAIHRLKDPTTSADEVLRGSTFLLHLSLLVTGVMGTFAYYTFFSFIPSTTIAVIAAIVVGLIVEMSKKYCLSWAVRIPFLEGFRSVFATPDATLRWASLLCLGIVVFAVSAYNSTKGAERVAIRLDREQTHQAFTPNTADIDAQIAAVEGRMARNNANTWKGVVSYVSQKANNREASVLAKLQDQRATVIAQQRADWEKQTAIQEEERAATGFSVLAIGGWMEAFQVLLLLLRGACEKSLDARMRGNASPTPQGGGIGFQRPAVPTAVAEGQPQRPIGFHYPNRDVQAPQDAPTGPHVEARLQDVGAAIVSRLPSLVSRSAPQTGSVGSDQGLRDCSTRLKREIANLRTVYTPGAKRNGLPDTILGRMEEALYAAFQILEAEGFNPTPSVFANFREYVTGEFSESFKGFWGKETSEQTLMHYYWIWNSRIELLTKKMEAYGNLG